MSKIELPVLDGTVAEPREQQGAEARFKKVLMGFDPQEVNSLIKSQREVIAQLQAELLEVRQKTETLRAEADARLASQAASQARLSRAWEERGTQLEEARRKLGEATRETETARAELQRESGHLTRLRESVEPRHMELMRAQLISVTRESSESTVKLTAARQEIKILKGRLAALSADCEASSAALEEERARQQSRQLTLDRSLARAKARSHQLGLETAARLRETADLISASFSEGEALLSRLEEPAAYLSRLSAQAADKTELPAS